MYFANNGGLLEFDGARWRTFHLPNHQVVRAVAWSEGKVFVGGFAEFGYFEPDNRTKWRYHSLSSNLQSDLSRREEIWHILARPDAVYFQSFSTIYRYDGKTVVQVSPPSNLMFLHQIGERLIFPGIERGLYEMMPGGGFRLLEGTQVLKNAIVAFILPGKGGSLFVGTKNDGFFTYADGECLPWGSPLSERIRLAQPNKAVKLPDGGIAIGTILDGVFVLDSLKNLRFHLNRENGLQDNTVLSMFSDCSGNLWLGLDKGIDLLELNSPLTFFNDRSGKVGVVYTAAVFQQNLYIGTNHGVFFKPADSNVPGYDFKLVAGTQGQVWQLQVLDNQLIAGHNDGTFRIEGATAAKISDVTGGWTTLPLPGRHDALLQGTYTGLVVFKKNAAGAWAFSHRLEGFSEPVKQMVFDTGGSLWLAHPNRGLWRVRLSDDLQRIVEIKQFTSSDGLPLEFEANLTVSENSLCVQLDTNFFCAENHRLVEARHPCGISHSKIISLPSGECFCVDPKEVTFLNPSGVGKQKLPLSLVPGNEKIIPISPGVLLFCMEDGYALWNEDEAKAGSPICDNELKISAVEVLTNPPYWFFPTPGEERIELPANQVNLRLYRTAASHTHLAEACWEKNGGNRFCSKAPFLELTGLASGEHLIELTGASEVVKARLIVYIHPPWWRTWWAVFLWMMAGVVVLWLLERYYHRRLARQRKQLQKEKERELSAQRIEADRERLQTEVDNKNRELSNATLNLIRKNEALLALRSELEKMTLSKPDYGRLDRLIETHLSGDKDWEMFETAFNQVHDAFFKKLKAQFPELTPGDLRLAAFLKLNLSSKEIASLLGLSVRGVENKRYRLRKKMGMNEEENLAEKLMEM